MEKDKVAHPLNNMDSPQPKGIQPLQLDSHCPDYRAEAARPSVPAQGEMLNFIDWVKSDKVTDNPESKIFDAYGQYCYALAASRSEAQPPQNEIPLCAGHAEAWFCDRNHLKGNTDCVVCAFLGAPAAGSAEREIIERCAKVADAQYDWNHNMASQFDANDQQKLVDRALANASEASRIAEKIRALAGTDTDVAKEK